MTDQTETDAPGGECLADLFARLKDQGADLEHLHAVAAHQRLAGDAAIAKAARLFYHVTYYMGDGEKPLRPIDLEDELGRMTSRASGLVMAILGSELSGDERLGLHRLAQDLEDGLERLAAAFAAERRVSVKGEK